MVVTEDAKPVSIDDVETTTNNDEVVDINNENKLEEVEIKYSEDNLKEALSGYDNISVEDAQVLMKLIEEYSNGRRKGFYEDLPKSVKELANGIVKMSIESGARISKDAAAMLVLDNFITDAKFNSAMDEYKRDMNEAMLNMNKEYANIFNDAFNDTFSKIDEIKAENPEQAERIIKVKEAFDNAMSLSTLKEYCKSDAIYKIKLNKKINRFNDETFYFNKKVNVTDVKIPNIGDLLNIISVGSGFVFPNDEETALKFSPENIKKFIICIIYSTIDLDLNIIENLSYLYRLVDNIYRYKFVDALDEKAEELFRNIAEVIDIINSR